MPPTSPESLTPAAAAPVADLADALSTAETSRAASASASASVSEPVSEPVAAPVSANPAAVGIAILAKAPLPGYAKTRLVPLLGPAGAAALQDWLTARAVTTALAAATGPVTLWAAPDTTHPAFGRHAGRVDLRPQPAGDLGQRMLAAVAAATTPAGTLVIGTDCPALSADHLQQAAAALQTHDATLIPAEDGGYVLIGLRRAVPEVFAGVDWSTPRVLAQTRQRLAAAGLDVFEFSPLWDVDRSADYERLCARHPELAAQLATQLATPMAPPAGPMPAARPDSRLSTEAP